MTPNHARLLTQKLQNFVNLVGVTLWQLLPELRSLGSKSVKVADELVPPSSHTARLPSPQLFDRFAASISTGRFVEGSGKVDARAVPFVRRQPQGSILQDLGDLAQRSF
jgi:hypothetical protein